MTNSIKDMVSDNKQVKFTCYRSGNLWYQTECGFMFPVPLEEAGNAPFWATDKALLFMRYIRKQLELTQGAKNARAEVTAEDSLTMQIVK